MSRCSIVLLLICLLPACTKRDASPTSLTPGASVDAIAGLEVAPAVTHGNLAIFPIISSRPQPPDRFITLDEGLAAGTVEVFEIGAATDAEGDEADSAVAADDAAAPPQQAQVDLENNPDSFRDSEDAAEVNRVMVVNQSGKPLYLMPGEIIMGGDQDRCVAEEFVLQPGSKPTPVEVFCVEHGRWGGRAPVETEAYVGATEQFVEFGASLSLVVASDSDDLAEDANRGKFIASAGAVSKPARMAVQESQDQQTVWQNVGNVNSLTGNATDSGTFAANYVNERTLAELQPYVEAVREPVADVDNVVGVIVAVNGEVHSLDRFESTALFKKLWPKLLKSYALDAVSVADAKDAAARCGAEEARDFLAESMRAGVEKSETNHGVSVTRRSSSNVVSFSAEDASMAADGFGGGVHASAFSKSSP